MFVVYILYSQQRNRYYIGHTDDVEKRLAEHIQRRNLGASDWIVKYREFLPTRGQAMQREYEIKSKKKRSYIEVLIATAG